MASSEHVVTFPQKPRKKKKEKGDGVEGRREKGWKVEGR
jgi:hypothetical protein